MASILRAVDAQGRSAKPYFVSAQEWKVGILLLVLVTCTRIIGIDRRVADPSVQALINDRFSLPNDRKRKDVLAAQVRTACNIDTTVLCSDAPTTCFGEYFNPSLAGWLWSVLPGVLIAPGDPDYCLRMSFEKIKTSPRFQWCGWNVTVDDPVEKEASQAVRTDPETKLILHILVYTMGNLQTGIYMGLPVSVPLGLNNVIRVYFKDILDFFATSTSKTLGYTNKSWTKEEILALMRLATRFVQLPAVRTKILVQESLSKGFYQVLLPRAIQVVEQLKDYEPKPPRKRLVSPGRVTPRNSETSPHTVESNGTTYTRYPFFKRQDVDNCMYSFYEDDELLSRKCHINIEEGSKIYPFVPSRDEDDQCEDATTFYLTMLIIVGLVFPMSLYRLFKSKESLKQKFDTRRRQLQDELEDPYLRSVLESRFPPQSRERAMAKLEEHLANWDSKAAAVRRLRVLVRGFRFMALASAVIWVPMLLWMRQENPYCSVGLCLDNMFVPLAVFVASYWIPLNLEQFEILAGVAATELSDVQQPLLLEEEGEAEEGEVESPGG